LQGVLDDDKSELWSEYSTFTDICQQRQLVDANSMKFSWKQKITDWENSSLVSDKTC